MKLFIDRFWISPYVFSSFIALKEKGISFETVEIALDKKENQRGDYSRISYTSRVPAISDGEFHLAESSAIAEYLEETFAQGAALFPKDKQQRANARMLMAWLRSDLSALRAERATHTMFYKKSTNELSPAARADVDRLTAVCESFIHGKNLFGEWTLADSELAFMIHRLILNGDYISDKMKEYAAFQWERPSVVEFVQKSRPPYVNY